jgi:hypothetical protein
MGDYFGEESGPRKSLEKMLIFKERVFDYFNFVNCVVNRFSHFFYF